MGLVVRPKPSTLHRSAWRFKLSGKNLRLAADSRDPQDPQDRPGHPDPLDPKDPKVFAEIRGPWDLPGLSDLWGQEVILDQWDLLELLVLAEI